MWDGLFFRSNFYTKCKSALKMIKMRMDVIMKKRNAMQKFLKKDIADLINDRLDYNAYGRAAGLYMELNSTSCYHYVEECSRCIADHLKDMHKQGECPDECKIAVASLIYAAARFADLPELRNLRNLFIQKYGNDLDPFLNKEFAEKLRSAPPTRKMKLQLMQDVAQEFSIQWDPISLEKKFSSTGPAGTTADDDDAQKFPRSRSVDVPRKGKQDRVAKDDSVDESGLCPLSDIDEGSSVRRYDITRTKGLGISKSNVEEKVPAYERKPITDRYVPAPYAAKEPSGLGRCMNVADPTGQTPREKDHILGFDNPSAVGEGKPKPRSVRQRFLKKPEQDTSCAGPQAEPSNARGSPTGLQQDKSDVDDREERMLDQLLMHHSEKRSPKTPQNPGHAKVLLKSSRNQEECSRPQKSELPLPPGRRAKALSMADEVKLVPSAVSDNRGWHSRAASLDGIGHVHPRMPDDYDELADRIAALRKMNV